VRGGGQAMAKKLRTRIKESLTMQLQDMRVTGDHFYDLVDDYMALWDIKNDLIKDIKTRGVAIPWQNSETQKGTKKNDSVSELHKTNAQMLKILQQLNITTDEVVDDDVEEL